MKQLTWLGDNVSIEENSMKPVAWVFELAKSIDPETGEYCNFGKPQLSFTEPYVPEGSIRNKRPLFAADEH